MIREVTKDSFKKDIVDSDKVELLKFTATWCPPCRQQEPILKKISESRSDYGINEIDVDKFPEVAQFYGVQSIPTMIFFKQGDEVERVIGVHTATQLNAIAEKHI